MSGWRPIESAPRDGAAVLLYEPSSANGVRGGCVLQAQWEADRRYVAGGFWRSPLSQMGSVIPLAWMPLPPPPPEAESGEGTRECSYCRQHVGVRYEAHPRERSE